MKIKEYKLPFLIIVSSFVLSSSTLALNANNDSPTVQITFNAGEGVFKGAEELHTRTIDVRNGTLWKSIKDSAPKNADIIYKYHILDEWTIGDPATSISDDYVFNEDTILNAKYSDAYTDITFVNTKTGDFDLPITTAKIEHGVRWKDIKSNYEPIKKESAPEPLKFKYFKDETNKIITDDYVFSSPTVTTTFTTEYDTGEASDFSTDSWFLFDSECSKYSLSDLKDKTKSKYGNTYESTTYTDPLNPSSTKSKTANSFLGVERVAEIAGKKYLVRVIDEGKDIVALTDERQSTVNATFTFEFVDIIEDGVSYNAPYKQNNKWLESSLRSTLNKDGEIYESIENDLKNSIVPVMKRTYEGNGAATTSISSRANYLFPLSLKEMNYSGNMLDKPQVPVLNEGLGSDGSESYLYYQNFELTTDRTKSYDSVKLPYLTRSPYIYNNVRAWYIDSINNGKANAPYDVNKGLGLSPAFCVGSYNLLNVNTVYTKCSSDLPSTINMYSKLKGKITADDGATLPASIKIEMKDYNGDYQELSAKKYSYVLSNDNKTANLTINNGIINGELRITIVGV